MGTVVTHPTARRAAGVRQWVEVFGTPPAEPRSPLAEAALDFVCAEVWSRPGLTRRDRRLLTLTCLATELATGPLQIMVESCIRSGEIAFDELQEIAVELSVWVGFPTIAEGLHRIVLDAAASLGLAHLDADEPQRPSRRASASTYPVLPVRPGAPIATGLLILGESAPTRLNYRERSLLSIAVVGRASLPGEIRDRCRAALRNGELTVAELHEVALHLAAYVGFPRAGIVQSVIDELRAE